MYAGPGIEAEGQVWFGLETFCSCPRPTRWASGPRTLCGQDTNHLSIKITRLLLISIFQITCKMSLVIYASLELCSERNSGKHSLDTLNRDKAKHTTQGKLFCIIFFKRFYLFFREKRSEGEREGKKQCMVASHTPPNGDLACNPGLCPDWESNQWPFGSQASTHSTEPHQPGMHDVLFKYELFLSLNHC